MTFSDQLKPAFKGEVLEDDPTLTTYSKDASLFEIRPQLVVYPQDTEDIKTLIKFVTSHQGLSVIPRSAGTDMSGGAIGEGIIADVTKHLNKITEIGQDFAVTEPGVFYRDFEKETLKHDLLLPCYTASREINTVGGMVANNSAGEKTLAFGQTKDFVEQVKVVLVDGNEYTFGPLTKEQLEQKLSQKDFEGQIYQQMYQLLEKNYDLVKAAKPQVSKNSTGYLLWEVWDRQTFDLSKIFVGSQGTLGFITEAKLRLVKPKKYSKLLVVFLYNLDHLGGLIEEVLKFHPESFESYDDQTLKFATRFIGEVLKVIHPKNIVSLGFNFIPEALMALTHGFPKLVLLAEFTGDSPEEVLQKATQAQKDISKFHVKTRVTKDGDDERKYFVVRRESFNLFRHHAGSKHTAPFIDDIVVKPEYLPEFLPKLQKIMEPYKSYMTYTIAGHVGNGNFHIIPLVDMADPRVKQAFIDLGKKVYDLTLEYKGSISAEHNDGLVRGPYLKQMYGEKVFDLFKQVKTIFDPNNIFNPHKKSDATFEYSWGHLAKK